MGFDIGGLGQQVAGGAIGAGMGLLLGKINDDRQIKQQERLQSLQIAGQKEMGDYNYAKQLQMWKDTNYSAQVDELNKAGLNAGLMYGMGGGGGTTTGSGGGSVTGATAGQNTGEVQQMANIGMGIQLMDAQKKVLETQADKNQAEADATRGIKTDEGKQHIEESKQLIEESKARIDNLKQGLDNQKQDWEIKKLDITMKNIENFEKQASQPDRLKFITYETKTAIETYKSAAAEAQIDQATVKDKIKIIGQQAIEAVLKNALIKENTTLTKEQQTKTIKEVKLIGHQIMQGWDKLDQGQQQLLLNRLGINDNSEKDVIDKSIRTIFSFIPGI